MPFDFKNKDRLKNLLEELEGLRYRNMQDITEFLWYEDDGEIGNREPVGTPQKVGPGFSYKGWDKYHWLCTKITIPEELAKEAVIGFFDFGVPIGTGNNSNFESLLYVNGAPYQGVDGNHREVFLDVETYGRELDLTFRIWSGLNGGGRPKDMSMEIVKAQFGILDQPTDDLYYLAKNALEAYEELDQQHEYREWILNELVQAFRLVDYTETGSAGFYESTKAAYAYLNDKLDGRGKPDVQISMIGHTHIDVAWLWRLKHTREKAARSFSTVNRLMDRYDDYQFLQSQPQLYEYIKQDYPDIYEHIKKRVAQGKWDPSGAMWVECDCNIASGESIVRQILIGKNFFMEEFGVESEFLWLPDVFGYSWAMPQILRKSNVNTFMTTKISWNDTNKMPYDTFMWRGIDGTEVLTHFVTTADDWDGATSYTYNGDTRPYAVKGVWDNYGNKDSNRELLISYGYGDGGGGPTRDMIKNLEHLNKIPGIPHVKNESATSYFRQLHKTVSENAMHGYQPVWDGELYLEFHRGTYTSQAYNKKTNREMENALYQTELMSVIANQFAQVAYHREELLKAWKIVLTHQFHDILPGSSIKEVYDDSRVEYGKAKALLQSVMTQVEAGLMKEAEHTYTVLNNSSFVRDSYVTLERIAEDEVITDACGRKLPTVLTEEGTTVLVKEMQPFAFTTLMKQKREADQTVQKQEADRTDHVDTAYYHVAWNEAGQLTRIYDKQAKREILPAGSCGNVLQLFEDKPRCFDAWELEATIDLKKKEITGLETVKIEHNEIGIFVSFSWKYHKSCIRQTMCLYHDKRRIDFKTCVDWQERQTLLKAAFPVQVRAVDARFDIQFGNIRRAITRNNSWEAAKFEVVAHKWVDMSETGYGVALLNDCKYGHDIKDQVMRISLLKSAVDPDYTADLGTHHFTYSLLPHSGEWYEANIEQEAYDLNHPLHAVPGTCQALKGSLLVLDQENVEVDCVKLAEHSEDIIIRFHEFMGRRSTVSLLTALPVEAWYECNLMEEALESGKTTPISLDIKPYEIKTIVIQRRK